MKFRQGSLVCYFGRLGAGKTYAMTSDVLSYLNSGELVYTNYQINWSGYDERRSLFNRVLFRLRLKKGFTVYPASNLRSVTSAEDLFKIQNAIIALDEGYLYFDSYVSTKLPIKIRHWVLHLRKHHNVVLYTTQRPMQVHKVMRAMTNRFFRLRRYFIPGIPVFMREEFDIGSDENIDLEAKPISRKLYPLWRRVASAYNTDQIIWDAVTEYKVDTTPAERLFITSL